MIESIIKELKLVPLTGEGGMYRYLYAGEKDAAGREYYSSIYYLLTEHSFSHMHRLKTDEIYHYYMGDGLELLLLYPDGTSEIKVLGTRLSDGEVPQFRVPAGVWQGSVVAHGGRITNMVIWKRCAPDIRTPKLPSDGAAAKPLRDEDTI